MDKKSPLNTLPNIFVMMQFANDFKPVREAVRGASSKAGFHCIWADELHFVGKITETIEAQIRLAHFCICDITSKNPNVVWECGYAMAIGKKIIFLSQNMDDLFFDIKNNRTIIYDCSKIDEELIEPLLRTLDTFKSLAEFNAPELLIGTKNHEKLRIVASAKNIRETPYGIFNLMSLAKEHIFIAGQNLYYIIENNLNKQRFKTELKKFLDRSLTCQVDVMICDETCSHAIQTWEYAQSMSGFKGQLEKVIEFFSDILNEINIDDTKRGKFTVKKFDFVPVSASFIDPTEDYGIAVITPAIFQKINNKKPCYILSNFYNKEIFQEYWAVYYHWFTTMADKSL